MNDRSIRRSFPARLLAGVLLCALVSAQAGCYSVRPIDTPEPQPGTRVIASLTDAGAQDVAGQVGPRARAVEGMLERASADTLEIGVIRVVERDGGFSFWNQERVRIPTSAVATLDERMLDTRRSILAAGGITAGALLLARAFSAVFTGGGSGEDPVPPN
jgi:hypothetical protein